MPTLVSNGILLVFTFEDWQIDFHMASWLPAASAMIICLEPPDLSDHDVTLNEN